MIPQLHARKTGWTTAIGVALSLYLLALALRLVPVAFSPDLGISLDDMLQYDMLGRSLAEGDGYRWYQPRDLRRVLRVISRQSGRDFAQIEIPQDPRGIETSFRAPLYPALLSLIYRATGRSGRFLAARFAQSFVVASLAPLAYGIARQLKASERYARLAGVLAAAWPLLVTLPLALATENLFLPLLAAGVLSLVWASRTGEEKGFALAGFLLGLATLTRSVIVGFPLLAALELWRRRQRRASLLLILPLVLLTAPWALRNTLLHGQPTFLESSLGYNLYLGYHPETGGTFQFGPSLDLIAILDDAERNRVGSQLAWQFIRQDPGRIPLLTLQKVAHFWGLEDRAFAYLYSNSLFGPWPPLMVGGALFLLSLPLVVTLPLAIAGWALCDRNRAWRLLTLLFAWYIGIHALIMSEERFHFALVPMIAAFAAAGLTRWPAMRRKLHGGDRTVRHRLALALVLIALALVNWGWEIGANLNRYRLLMEPAGWLADLHY